MIYLKERVLSEQTMCFKNSSLLAIREAQAALSDVDVSEDDILNDVMELRYGKGDEK